MPVLGFIFLSLLAQAPGVTDGVFYLNADGKNGMSSPHALRPGKSARAATSATSGGSVTLVFRDLPERAVISARGGRGGHGGNGASGRRGADGRDGKNARLYRDATRGEDGEDGGGGGNGGHGGHGGAGGNVRIIYVNPLMDDHADEDWQEAFEVYVSGGIGGNGGYPGYGGREGRGGIGGKGSEGRRRKAGRRRGYRYLPDIKRPDGQPGQPGQMGRRGRTGEDGDNGRVEFIQVRSVKDWVLEEFLQDDRLFD